jgi:hypothetical protein
MEWRSGAAFAVNPGQKLAKIIKRLEGNGHKVTNMADRVKAIGFVGGIGEHQKRNQSSAEQNTKTGAAPDGK